MPNRAHIAVLLCGLTLAGCSISILPNESGTSSTTSTSTTSDDSGQGQSETGMVAPASTSSPTTTGDPTTTGATSTSGENDDAWSGFIIELDGGVSNECDPYTQDCADGQKCTWWASDGGSAWNATKCVPIAEDPAQLAEPCVAEGGGVSGEDDCDKGLMCWDVDAEGNGTCTAFCMGSERQPMCPPGYGCTGGREGLSICIKYCDPLAQDCPDDDLCLPVNSTYLCVLDASRDEGQLGDPCEYANACDKGLICLGPQAASECDQGATGCCQPMCDLDKPNNCPGAGQICEPVYEPQPPTFEHIGYCTLPQ